MLFFLFCLHCATVHTTTSVFGPFFLWNNEGVPFSEYIKGNPVANVDNCADASWDSSSRTMVRKQFFAHDSDLVPKTNAMKLYNKLNGVTWAILDNAYGYYRLFGKLPDCVRAITG